MQNADTPTIPKNPLLLPQLLEADMNGHTRAAGTAINRSAISLLLFCLAALFDGSASRIAAAETITSVTILTFAGTAEISRRPGVWDPAHTNQVLLVRDRLRTAKDSQATIRLSDGTIMRMGAQASFQVLEPKRRTSLNPLSGLFYFFHRDRPGEWELRNRTAVAAVRGTEFHLEASEDGTWLLSVIEGEVEVETEKGNLDLKSRQAGTVRPGLRPEPVLMREANDLIQWCLYYPAVLDADELGLSAGQQAALKDSLTAYRSGDLKAALEYLPSNPTPDSDSERIFRAALLLAVGQVQEASELLALSSRDAASARHRALASAVGQLIATVKSQSRTKSPEFTTASEWLAESYRLQSEGKLDEALRAARKSIEISPKFGFGWERVAELEFSFGRVPTAREALNRALELSPRNAQAVALRGFLFAAENRIQPAIASFDEAIALDGALANAWLGRGLCRIREGNVERGRQDLEVAAALEPQRSLLRSYLGKAFSETGNYEKAAREQELARQLDPNDPTSWLYSALLLRQENRVNEAIQDLEKSQELNENRRVYRSRLLLDQDRAVRGANLATLYADAGFEDVSEREAIRAVHADYANFSSHLFLADSYNALRDPRQVNLRFETPWLSEYLVANLLAPAGAGTLSPLVTEQEYSKLFERDRVGFSSETVYLSRGDWIQNAVQHGTMGNSSYAAEMSYRSENGERPNNDLNQMNLSLKFKQQIDLQNSVYLQTIYYDAEGGDLAPRYDPGLANPGLRFTEKQEPILLAGYHHEWQPGIHTLFLGGRLQDTIQITNSQDSTVLVDLTFGTNYPALLNQNYQSRQETYTAELQQIFEVNRHTIIFGGRFQTGNFDTQNRFTNATVLLTPPNSQLGNFLNSSLPPQESVDPNFQRGTLYGYYYWEPLSGLKFIGGLSYDYLKLPVNFRYAPLVQGEQTKDQISPKGGIIWNPLEGLMLRAAYARGLTGASIDQSFQLEPTQIAGFIQTYRSLIPEAVAGANAGEKTETIDFSVEKSFHSGTYLGFSGEYLESKLNRDFGVYTIQFPSLQAVPAQALEALHYQERSLAVTLDQLVGSEWAFGAHYRVTRSTLENQFVAILPSVQAPPSFLEPGRTEATLHQLNLFANYNHPSGFFSQAQALWFSQRNSGYSPDLPGDDFWQFNLFAGYRFWRRQAELTIGLLNLTDQDYRLNPLNLTTQLPRNRAFELSFRFSF